MFDASSLSSGRQTADSSQSRRTIGKRLNEDDRVNDGSCGVDALERRKVEIENRLLELETRLERVQRVKAQTRQQQILLRRNRSKSANNNTPINLFRLRPPATGGLRQDRFGIDNIESSSLSRVRKSETPPFIVLDHDPGRHVNRMGRAHLAHNELSRLRRSIFGRLETERYFWGTPTGGSGHSGNEERDGHRLARFLPTVESIPMTSDVILDSDWPTIDRTLKEIRHSLENFREFRLNMPTHFYQQAYEKNSGSGMEAGKAFSGSDNGRKSAQQSVTFAELRVRVLNMEFHIERRTREILASKSSDSTLALKPEQKVVRFDTCGLFISNETHMTLRKDRSDLEIIEQPTPLTVNSIIGRENSPKLETDGKFSVEKSEFPEHSFALNQSNQEKPTNKRQQDVIPPKTDTSKPEILSRNIESFRETGNAKPTTLITATGNYAASDNDKEKTVQQSSYDRMLAIIKGPTTHFEVSSSSSENEEPKMRTKTVSIKPEPVVQQPVVPPKQTLLSSNSPGGNAGKASKSKTIMEMLNEKSSDSDFFD